MRSIPGGIDGLEAVFDDSCLVADGGLLLTGTVMHRLGLEAMVDETVRLDGRVAGSGSGRKVLSLVALNRPGIPGGSVYWFPTVCWSGCRAA